MNTLGRISRPSLTTNYGAGIDTLVMVDDDADMIMAMTDLYEMMFGKVMGFTDPTEAKSQILRLKERALILSDYDMPNLTGAELARQTHDRRQEENSPMLIQTGHSDSVRRAELDEMVSLGIIDGSYLKGKHDILTVLEAYHNGDPIPTPSLF